MWHAEQPQWTNSQTGLTEHHASARLECLLAHVAASATRSRNGPTQDPKDIVRANVERMGFSELPVDLNKCMQPEDYLADQLGRWNYLPPGLDTDRRLFSRDASVPGRSPGG